jgi:putative zinc-dependent peptidase DUF5700
MIPLLALALLTTFAQGPASRSLDVTVVTDEADAALAILDTRAMGGEPTDSQWQRLFATEGYRRLAQRERSMGRPFDDSTFRAFLSADSLLDHIAALRGTLRAWRAVDPRAAAQRAFAYLPGGARIRAKVYPIIKPGHNSFVFEPSTNPAIFLYLDPLVSPAKFENTLAHELHHIGVGSVCGAESDTTRPRALRMSLDWMSGFAEGRAVLAAAGSPDVHPHLASNAEERRIWDRDVANVAVDLGRLEAFFLDLLDGRLDADSATRRGFTFIATDSVPQGPFYTVGWLMATTVERALGRARLDRSICDPVRFLEDYNRAAFALNRRRGSSLPLWSGRFLQRLDSVTAAAAPSSPVH